MTGIASLPRVMLSVDGADAPQSYMDCLGGIRVRQCLSVPTQCELTFYDPPRDAAAEAFGLPGTAITVHIDGHLDCLFAGEVTAMEFSHEAAGGLLLRLRAYDPLHRLRRRQPLRVHKQLNCAELASELVADLGLHVEASASGPTWQHLIQHDLDDFEMLADVAQRSGVHFVVHDDCLKILTLAGDGPAVPLTLGESLLEANIELNSGPASDAVKTLAWTPWLAEARAGECGQARNHRERPAPPIGDVPVTDVRTLTGHAVESDDQAEALAQRELDERASGLAVLWGVAEGNPGLRPGTPIEVSGVARAAAGRYVVTQVTHTLDRERGYLSEIDTRAPAPSRPPDHHRLAGLGEVTDVADPEDLGRVRVTLPGHGDLESEWLEVLLPAAGAGKGIIALPDVGDRVLVLFVHGNAAQAIVLGGLYGSETPPDTGVADAGIGRFTIVTAGGQRIQLDDTESALNLTSDGDSDLELSPGIARLHNDAGCFLELDGSRIVLHAVDELVLEAPGGQVTVRANAIDFERG